MNHLSPKEKRDLQHVFASISDVRPSRRPSLSKLRFLMYHYCIWPLCTLPKKLVTGRQ
jgi:hypothetical protein